MIKDGDVFRWRYKDEQPDDRRQYSRYHCKSQIAIAAGTLVDTFWGGLSSSAGWSYAEAERDLELTFLGNLADLEKRPEYEAAYYDDADIVNLNHSNSSRSNFYIRKGAQRSRTKMLATIAERRDNAERTIRSQQDTLDRLKQMAADVEGGKPLEEVHL